MRLREISVHYCCTFFLPMTIKLVGIKEFRRNLTKYSKEARSKNVYFIVMRHSQPIMKVMPVTQKELELEKLRADIAEARAQARRGEGYSSAEIRSLLGI